MSKLVPPHGGILKPLLLDELQRSNEIEKAKLLKKIYISSRETSDLLMLGMGAFSPLDGFMKKEDYINVVKNMCLTDNVLWPIPITLAVSEEEAARIKINEEVALIDRENNELMATLKVEEKFDYDKKFEAENVFKTTDENHPGVAKIYDQPGVYLGGSVTVISEGNYPKQYGDFYARPVQTREIFEKLRFKPAIQFTVHMNM
jgi:sulfate adenylyltransferase